MHAWARWTILFVILALSASVAPPARADFGDCNSNEYLGRFDERLRAPRYLTFECVERLRVPAAGREIRIIHDFNVRWIVSDSEMAEIDRGVRAAAEAMGRLGGVAMDDVTILLADDLPPRDRRTGDFSDVAAYAEMINDGECRVIFYLAGPGSLPENAAFVTAHELFHCVQAANLSPAQMSSGSEGAGGGGDWWMEGSANWFAGLALPDAGPLPAYVDDFDSASPTTPLNRMAYGAVVFFFWLSQDMSPSQVMLFLAGMAPSRAESAQRSAMMSALPQERWLKFAEDYLDSRIRHPHGTDIGLSPEDGDVWEWSATRTQSLPLEPFVLLRGKTVFECGRWRTSVRPAPAHHARSETGGDWAPLPAEIDTSSGSGGNFRFVAMNAAASRVTMNIVGTMESGCGDCAGVRTTDACLVGSWTLSGGGSIEWMRRYGAIGEYSAQNRTITFRRDGTYVTGVVEVEGHAELRDGARADSEGRAQAGGRWSTSEGVLNLCADMQMLAGRTVITTPDGQRITVPIGPAPPVASSERYSCSAGSLSTVREIPEAPPMPSEYTRTSPPPSE